MNKKNCVSLLLLAAIVSQQALPSAAQRAALNKAKVTPGSQGGNQGGQGGTSTRPQPAPERPAPEPTRDGRSVAEIAADYSDAVKAGAANVLIADSSVDAASKTDKNVIELVGKIKARG